MLYEDMDNNQYPIERDLFRKIFGFVDSENIFDFLDFDYESYNFKYWKYEDEYFILRKTDGVLINWYKHVGRCNTANMSLEIMDYYVFAKEFVDDLKENGCEFIEWNDEMIKQAKCFEDGTFSCFNCFYGDSPLTEEPCLTCSQIECKYPNDIGQGKKLEEICNKCHWKSKHGDCND